MFKPAYSPKKKRRFDFIGKKLPLSPHTTYDLQVRPKTHFSMLLAVLSVSEFAESMREPKAIRQKKPREERWQRKRLNVRKDGKL